METPGVAPTRLRKVRSFVRRPGRATAAQRRAFAELLPRFASRSRAGSSTSSGCSDGPRGACWTSASVMAKRSSPTP